MFFWVRYSWVFSVAGVGLHSGNNVDVGEFLEHAGKEYQFMTTQAFLSFALSLFLASPVCAGEQEEIEKALHLYGDEVRTMLGDTEAALSKGLPEVEDYFRNPSESRKPQQPFFGFGEHQTPEPSSAVAPGCQTCQVQAAEVSGKPSGRQEQPAPQKASSFKPSSSSREVIVFVSLGLPDAVLKPLAFEAEKNKARLVIRGLVDNSFKATQTRLQVLKVSVEIDPTLFDLFEIRRVPVFIRAKKSSQGFLKEGHDRLEGNVPLSYALETFRERGERS